MKRKSILDFLGVFFIVSGLIVIIIVYYLSYSSKSQTDTLISNGVVYKKDNSIDLELHDEISNLSIEGLDSDQEISEIKDGTPVIEIPSLDIFTPVIDGTDSVSLRYGAGKFEESVDMGEVGNFCVAGHSSSIYNCIFNDLDKIRTLSKINCYNSSGKCFTYYVIDKFVTEPEDLSVLDSSNEKIMTIVTCAENGTKRLIVVAKMFSKSELSKYKNSLRSDLVYEAVDLAGEYTDICIDNYLRYNSIGKVPYNVHFNFGKDMKSCFYNFIVSKFLLKKSYNDFITFNQSVGFKVVGGDNFDI